MDIQGIYIALFGRPADPNGLDYLRQTTNSGSDLASLSWITGSPEYIDRFATSDPVVRITTIYRDLFGRYPDDAGLKYFVSMLHDGQASLHDIAIRIMSGAQGSDKIIVENKIAAANLFTAALTTPEAIEAYSGNQAIGYAQRFLHSVGEDPQTIPSPEAILQFRAALLEGRDPFPPPPLSPPSAPQLPTPSADDFYLTGKEDRELNGQLTGSGNTDLLHFTVVEGPKNGTLVFSDDGSFSYLPDADFSGTDIFSYRVNDGDQSSRAADVTLEILPSIVPQGTEVSVYARHGLVEANFLLNFDSKSNVASFLNHNATQGNIISDFDDNVLTLTPQKAVTYWGDAFMRFTFPEDVILELGEVSGPVQFSVNNNILTAEYKLVNLSEAKPSSVEFFYV